MAEHWYRRVTRPNWLLICGLIFSYAGLDAALSQFRNSAAASAAGEAVQFRKLYRIEVEDADEAGLIQQQLKITPEVVRGPFFYYFGDESINRRLISYGYSPVAVELDEIVSRVVQVAPQKSDAALRQAGVKILLQERENWYLRGTVKQLEALAGTGYQIREPGSKVLVPRRIQILLPHPGEVNKQVGGRVEINEVRKDRAGRLIVVGEAFDDAIAELRTRGLKVDILPDYPGIVR
jgi:hypothetical protein